MAARVGRGQRARWALLGLLVALLPPGLLLRSAAPADASVTAPGLRDVVVLKGLTVPTAVRFAPDGRVFVAEKSGRIKVFASLTATTSRLVVDLSPQVHDDSDRGLLGLALAPDFATDPALYVLYTYDGVVGGPSPRWGDDCPDPPGRTTDGCVVSGRLSRIPLTTTGAAGPEQVLLSSWCQQFSSHSVGSLAFDRTGALLVSAGEGASFGGVDHGQYGGTYAGDVANPCGDPPGPAGTALTAPTAQGGALRAQSLARTSGPTSLGGAVLRLDPRTGQGLPDNPFGASPDPDRRRIVAGGLRNPFRFAVRPGTDEVYVGDVGWTAVEEVDRIASVTDGVAENFGWPCYEGAAPQAGYQADGLDACARLYASGTAVPPLLSYRHSGSVVSGDGCPTGGSSISSLAFNTGDRYPAAYAGALFFGDYSRRCIWAVAAGPDGTPDPTRVSVVASAAAGPVDLQAGPDGLLYYLGLFDGSLHRIEPGSDPVPSGTTYVSDLPWTAMTNGWGPVERDREVGTPAAGDGGPLVVDGTTYAKGLGTHAYANVALVVPEGCTEFRTVVGVDDASGDRGSVVFRVLLDGLVQYVSPVVRGSGPGLALRVPVTPGARLQLRVGDSGNGADDDHADWGDARLLCGDAPAPGQPPVATIDSPSAPGPWTVGQVIAFTGSATDPDTGALPASALSWSLLQHHCPDGASCHTHYVQDWPGVRGARLATNDIDLPGWYELVLTATGPSGATGTASLRLDPQTVVLTFDTSPRVPQLVVGSEAGTPPFSRTLVVGGRTTVGAPSPQYVKKRRVDFRSWSDGGAGSHTVVAPASARTLTAYYK